MLKNALTIALLTHGATSADAACEGVISTFADECTYANFVANLSADCSIDELFPPDDDDENTPTPEDLIAYQCEYGAPLQFVEIQGTYQRDRRYFAGGGPLVDGENPRVEAAPIQRFETNLADSTLIAFPEYAARVQYNVDQGLGTNGYPANMNLEVGCDLNTVMCCFTEGDFATEDDATTDVCRHDLHDSPQSSHIKQGWSAFPGSESPVHCVGFTWKDGEEELLGNMMYDVSLRNSANKGYLKGVPGAPMCGCVEHMPVIEEAACRTAAKTDDQITYSFSYQPATEDTEGYLSASNTVGIAYSDCAAGDLKAQYVANQGGDGAKEALIDGHLVGAGGCAAGVEGYLNHHFTVEGQSNRYEDPDPSQWSDLLAGQGIYFLPPALDYAAADAEFRALVDGGCKDAGGNPRYCIVRRKCASCYDSHTDIYYQRLTTLPDPTSYNFLDLFLANWVNDQNDMAAGDFALYSTYDDALADTKAWTHCDYNDAHIGFPRNCGPRGHVGSNWNSFKRHSHGKHNGYYVEKPPLNESDA